MDGFEARMKFAAIVRELSASISTSQRAASFALKWKEHDEDFHSIIIEQLEASDMNHRVNIMYFIGQLLDLAIREKRLSYVRMMENDILRVIDAVAPSDGSGAANVKVIKKVFGGLQSRSLLSAEAMSKIDESLKERDTVKGWSAYDTEESSAELEALMKPMERRIEEDRERHKRQRENIWQIRVRPEKISGWNAPENLIEDDILAFDEEFEHWEDLGSYMGPSLEVYDDFVEERPSHLFTVFGTQPTALPLY